MVDRLQVEVAQVPEARWCSIRDDVLYRLLLDFFLELFKELGKVDTVLGLATSVVGARVFLFNTSHQQQPQQRSR